MKVVGDESGDKLISTSQRLERGEGQTDIPTVLTVGKGSWEYPIVPGVVLAVKLVADAVSANKPSICE